MEHSNSSGRSEDLNRPTGSQAGAPLPAELDWLRYGITAIMVATGLWLLFNKFGVEGMLSIGLVAIGLGFVIFFHELGHFAVAKWCDVHVEVFSVGFGPAIPGLSFRRGETLYKIAWFPLGGYVKMVGEGGESDEGDDDPRSFKNKSVWQRMAIISAGVTMNIILGLACFVIVYMMHGVERPVGVVGIVDAGSPAWQLGVPSGSIIHQIGSAQDPYFDDLQPEVAFSRKGQKLKFVYQPPGEPGKLVQTQIEPRRDEKDPQPVIGIARAQQLKFLPKRYHWPEAPTLTQSAGAEAEPPFELGDTIVASTDPQHPDRLKPLDGSYSEFERRLVELLGKPITVQVRRENKEGQESLVDIHVPPAYDYSLGLRMRMGQITAVRENSPAAAANVIARNVAQGVQEGDIIDRVEVTQPDGKKLRYVSSRNKSNPDDKSLDPLRLPFELQQWALNNKDPNKKVTLVVLRTANHAERGQEVSLELNWDERWRFDQEAAFSPLAPLPIPELGLAYQVETTIEAVDQKLPDGSTNPAWTEGLRPGDVIKAVRFETPGSKPGTSEPGKWMELDPNQWAYVDYSLQNAVNFKKVGLRVEHDGQVREVEVMPVPDPTWPVADRGLVLMTDTVLQKADSMGQAVTLGIQRTYYFIIQMYQSLRAIVTNRVSAKKGLGGPIMIATAAYSYASENIWAFLFFLGIISVNLAVINFLPIPILDGGHMVFLIYEKIRGIPASETARSAATIVGLAVILMLVVFTFVLDISRFF